MADLELSGLSRFRCADLIEQAVLPTVGRPPAIRVRKEVFITTTGVGVVAEGAPWSGRNAQPGDVILVSGTLGDHGMAIMAERESHPEWR